MTRSAEPIEWSRPNGADDEKFSYPEAFARVSPSRAGDVRDENRQLVDALKTVFDSQYSEARKYVDGMDSSGVLSSLTGDLFQGNYADSRMTRESISKYLAEANSPAGAFANWAIPGAVVAELGAHAVKEMSGSYFPPEFVDSLKYLNANWGKLQDLEIVSGRGRLTPQSAFDGINRLNTQTAALENAFDLDNPLNDKRLGNALPFGAYNDISHRLGRPVDQWRPQTEAERQFGICTIEGSPLKKSAVEASTVRKGEGPWASAQRLLNLDGQPASNSEIQSLTVALAAQYQEEQRRAGRSPALESLQANHQLLTAKNQHLVLQRIQDSALQHRLRRSFNMI